MKDKQVEQPIYGLDVRGVTKRFHRAKRTNNRPRLRQKIRQIFKPEKEVIRAVDDISLEVNIGEDLWHSWREWLREIDVNPLGFNATPP